MDYPFSKLLRLSLLSVIMGSAPAMMQANAQDLDEVEITTKDLGNGIYALFGAGGNIGASVGDDGVILVDDQYAPLTDKIVAALAEISDQDVVFVLNTHYHGDHTGGNENLGKEGSIIVAHDGVYDRVSVEQVYPSQAEPVPAFTKDALPKITFNDKMTFHLNGDSARAMHVPHAHTDGDSMIYFEGANVLHMGDLYFNYLYPYIDVEAGGTVDGVLAAQNMVLNMIDDETQIIPGHGPMATIDDLLVNYEMIKTVRDKVAKLKADGLSLEDVLGVAPSAEYDEKWTWSFINADKFVTSIYVSLP